MIQPAISESTALISAIIFTGLFVAPFYLSPTLRTTPLRSRDAPQSIKARVRAVGLSCLVSTASTLAIFLYLGHATPSDFARLAGIYPIAPLDCIRVLALVSVLFVGPLYETVLVDRGWRNLSWSSFRYVYFDSWTGYRNHLVAPICEELVFRTLVIALYLLAGVSPVRIVFSTPLIFGLAHLHHLAEFVQSRTPSGRRIPALNVLGVAVLRSLFQFTYTSLFGFFAAFVFLRTGSLYAAVVVHSFCNWMGFPRVWGRVGPPVGDENVPHVTPDVSQGKVIDASGSVETLHGGSRNLGIQWTVSYYALLVVGSWGFYKLLWPLTASSHALATF